MKDLKYLELQRLIKELQFVEAEYFYITEMVKIGDLDFNKSIDDLLKRFPQLKEVYDRKILELNKTRDTLIENSFKVVENKKIENIIENDDIREVNSDIKKLYRNIVKSTHPDKINHSKLNSLYIEATEAYEKYDTSTILKICNELDIVFDLNESFLSDINDKIKFYKERMFFLENTYTFKWLKSSDNDIKDNILLSYIQNRFK